MYNDSIRIYTHRGENNLFPENTIPAFKKGLENGATHIESDLRITKDKELILFHDKSAKRIMGIHKLIRECKLFEIKTWNTLTFYKNNSNIENKTSLIINNSIPSSSNNHLLNKSLIIKKIEIPTFEEALQKFSNICFNIDIKDNDEKVVKRVVQYLNKSGNYDRVLLTSFNSRNIKNIFRYKYKGEIGVSKEDLLYLKFLPIGLWKMFSFKGLALQIPIHFKNIYFDKKYLINRAHSLGMRVDYWVVNNPIQAKRLLELGADGIVTDDVLAIKDVVLEFAKNNNRKIIFPKKNI